MKKKKRVLIIRCGLLGDTVDATSVINPIREFYGESVEIDWVSKPESSQLFELDKRINNVYVLKHTKLPFILNLHKFLIILNSLFKPYDLILNLEIGNKFNDLVRYTRSHHKIGMPFKLVNDDIFKEHRVDHQLRILNEFFSKYNKKNAIPSIIGKQKQDLENKFPLKEKYIVLCPTNSHFENENYRGYRAWPINNWLELIKKILEQTELNILLVGSKNEEKYFKNFYPLRKRVYDLCGKTTVSDLITIMKFSEYVVATDSGSVHIAGASAKNIISIHGPTNYYQSAPYKTSKNNIKIASLNLKCSPCYDTQAIKECPINKCMHNLNAETIFSYIKDF
ncbi:MAG: hypothetical protein CMD65_01790 [Gammaproteobacteria bacterium]|nr:hypothetical protein [Gammaproteobacteria bacterium]|tara:strand:+ start:694 stop:1707 length:1014 start_codon:yes stop_codon:yes gene_type:complete